ncbi:Polyamine N-acetyltransferase 1, variant 2 [Coniochaeta pulveracea]|nr:Polyamine N-acetyltransferase 1, variant 2 [Coniochaeta pulveracea]
MLPPHARVINAAESVPCRHLHSSLNKVKHPVNVVRWTPEGRRLLTASTSGEFTLWNGTGFNFETIMQAHDAAIRACTYSHSDDWLVSADHDGIIKYWQPNFNNVQSFSGHTDPIRDLAFSPTDTKFVTASDDSTCRIFDFAGGTAETTLTGHGWDAKSCDWHPTKGLIVTGSKDHLVKLWDPRTGRCLTTLHGHKNTITATKFEKVRGMCLATSARDQTARVFDLRMMRDICLLRGHEKDIQTVAWHPIHSNLISTGGNEGSLFHYILDEPNTPPGQSASTAPYDSADPSMTPAQSIYPAHKIPFAHDFAIWSLDWHPLGHILASGSNDRITRFWARARPGDTQWVNDRYHIGEAEAEAKGTWDRRGSRKQRQEEEEQEAEDENEGLEDQNKLARQNGTGVPSIPGLVPGLNAGIPAIPGVGAAPPLPFPPPLPGANGVPPPPVPAGVDLAMIQEMMRKAGMQPPPPSSGAAALPPGLFPPPPGLLPPGLVPPPPGGFPGFAPPPPASGQLNYDDLGAAANRRRAPLPSQEESLRQEQQHGRYDRVR